LFSVLGPWLLVNGARSFVHGGAVSGSDSPLGPPTNNA